jgi:hypothetical protein
MSYAYTTFVQSETLDVFDKLQDLKTDFEGLQASYPELDESDFLFKLNVAIDKAEEAKQSGEVIDNFFQGRWGHEGIDDILQSIRG